jgi:hypothetical protein
MESSCSAKLHLAMAVIVVNQEERDEKEEKGTSEKPQGKIR